MARPSRRQPPAAPGVPRRPRPPEGMPDLGAEPIDARTIELRDEVWHTGLVVDAVEAAGGVAADVTIERCVLRGADLTGLRLERLRLLDVVLQTCDLSNLVLVEPSFVRVAVRDSRVAGLTFEAGHLEDLSMTACRGDVVSLIDVSAQRLLLDDCHWPEADLRMTRLEDLTVDGGAMRGSQWERARLERARFTNVDLAAVKGATGMAGASFDAPTLATAATALAAALGITVWDETPEG